jgi:uncharacterized hydrophobic protein (TIGR00271 family)
MAQTEHREPEPRQRSPRRRLHDVERRLQTGALHMLGLGPEERREVVHTMFTRRRRDAVEYWSQLLISVGIATVGLALNSTAVVIGAMLISPLMGPIVEFAVGLVVASPVLTVRSFGRMAGGIAAAVAGAAALTLLLPFQEITPEIAARTSPTALDLSVAILVALAAALTTVRSSSATTSAAAGTAIGISLVPPLCVIGYGLGIRDWDVAGGASLLFVTNLTAIVSVGVLIFWALGFEAVGTDDWDDAALATAAPGSVMYRILSSLHRGFGSRHGKAIRVLVPLLLMAAVAFPLSRALDQVAWEVRTRTAVSRIIDESTKSGSLVQSRVVVGNGAVSAWLYLVGSPEDAADVERELGERIRELTRVEPTVRVTAVPDLEAVRQAISAPAPEAAGAGRLAEVVRFQEQVAAAVRGVWPGSALGPVAGVGVEAQDSGRVRVTVRHLGTPADPAAQALLGSALSDRLSARVDVRTRAYPPGPVAAARGDGAAWLPLLQQALELVENSRGVNACVVVPEGADAAVAAGVAASAARLPAGRVAVREGTSTWEYRLVNGPCAPPPVPDSAAQR